MATPSPPERGFDPRRYFESVGDERGKGGREERMRGGTNPDGHAAILSLPAACAIGCQASEGVFGSSPRSSAARRISEGGR